jgi:hypothetical protein
MQITLISIKTIQFLQRTVIGSVQLFENLYEHGPYLPQAGSERHAFPRSHQHAPLWCSLYDTDRLRTSLHAVKELLVAPVHSVSRALLNSTWVDARLGGSGVVRALDSASWRELHLISLTWTQSLLFYWTAFLFDYCATCTLEHPSLV